MLDMIDSLAKLNEAKKEPGDYIQDGLLYCGHCHTPKQCRITFGAGSRIVGCQCACASRRYDAERAAAKDREEQIRIEELRASGIQDKELRRITFKTSLHTPLLKSCRRYVDNWETVYRENMGLLLWGDVESGKTHAAACIVNALIDRGVSALMTDFGKILNLPYSDRAEAIKQLSRFKMLAIDDLGAERKSDFALETVYTVINERYKSGKPLIITTNLPLQELENPKSIDYARIYSRVLEMCRPVQCTGGTLRKNKARERQERFAEFFRGGD